MGVAVPARTQLVSGRERRSIHYTNQRAHLSVLSGLAVSEQGLLREYSL